MPRGSRRRSRKHDGYREELDRSDSDEGPRPREQEEKKWSVRASKGSEQHDERLSSALAKPPDASYASGSLAEGQKKRKGREEQVPVAGDDRWSGGGGGEDDGFGYYDSKKSRNSDGDVKGTSTRKFEKSDRSNEVSRRKSEKGALLEEDSTGEHHRVKEGVREHGAEKSKESKQVVVLKEDSMDQQYKTVKDRSREHGAEKGNESRHDASPKVMLRNKEVKTRDSEGGGASNKCNGTDDRQFQDELHDGELEKNGRHRKTKDQSDGKDESQSVSRDRQTMSGDGHTKIDGCYEQQHRDVKFEDEMSRGVEKHREGKYKDERTKPEDRHKDNKYKDDRHKEEERHRDERYKEERSRNEDKHRDGKYKEDRSKELKDERYKEKSTDVEKPRNERSDDSSREKHRDDIYRNRRHQDGRSWDVRSSKDNTRDRSLEKHYKGEHNYSETRHNKNRLRDREGDASAADPRSSRYRDDNKGKKRSYEESVDGDDLEPRNAKEHHVDTIKRRSEVSSFLSSADRRREYVIQEKVDSQRRDYEKKSPTRSSTYPVREQSRHFPKQEESSPKEYSAASGRRRRTCDFQSAEGQSNTDMNMNESSLASKDGRSLRSDGRPIHFADRFPSASDWQVSNRSNLRRSHDTADDLLKKGNARHHTLPLNCQATENYQSASPGHLPPPPDRFEMDTRRSFEEDNRSHTRERRSSSRSRRSGTVDDARGHGNTWNNPSSWPSPVPNGFGPFQHGPPLPGFHPAMHQFPQSFFGMRPSMDMSHTGVPYPLHEHPESFSYCAQPFQWHNHAEDPYLPRLPGWDANRNVFEEHSHNYDRQELGRNKDLEFQQQPEVSFSAHGTSDKPSLMQFPGQIQSEQSNAESSEIKTVDETNAGKTDAQAPKYKSERNPGPSNAKMDNSLCSNYFKRLDISASLASPELYKKCVTMVGTLDPAGSCKPSMLQSLQNNKDEHGCQVKGSKYMIKSIFSRKTTSVFENAMALYRSSAGSMKSKIPASTHPESEEANRQASENMVGEVNVTAPEDQALPRTDMCDGGQNNDQPHDGMDLSMPGESGLAKDCSNREEDKVGSNTGDRSLSINHGEGHACYTAEQQAPSNDEGELPLDAKALQPCCNSEGSLTNVAKEQFSGVVSDAAFPSGSQACEDVMSGCRVNLNRIPCSPGST